MLDQMADESVCELLEVGLGMLARARLGDGLRTAAQSCVQGIVRACFARLKILTKDDVDRLMASVKETGATSEPTVSLVPQVPEVVKENAEGTEDKEDKEGKEDPDKAEATPAAVNVPEPTVGEAKASLDGVDSVEDQDPPPFTPHGLPTILELLRVLIALLNPSDQAHTDSMRLCALAILNTALEVGGVTLGKWPELREGLRDEGCRYLFQVSKSPMHTTSVKADWHSSQDPTRRPCSLPLYGRRRPFSPRCCRTSNSSWSYSCRTSSNA
jgi:brefeldin A-resistance guanine nucleotide exchange factor 1